ncbi:MAG: Bacterial regulatory protein luxR family [Actinomycetota bacterium]|nr:Bacterial regulatory protein luxR family [Actinomycetota bacterium]
MDHEAEITPLPLRGSVPPDETGWFLIAAEALPPEWRGRSIPVYLMPLSAADVKRLQPTKGLLGDVLEAEERAVAQLAARGAGASEISLQLHLSRRSVFRRLARLRQLVGAKTNAELATKLAKEDI